MQIQEARWIVAAFGLITCILIAVYVVKLFRDMALGSGSDSVNAVPDIERLRQEGKLNQEEYNRLKKAIPKNLIPGTSVPSLPMDVGKPEKNAPDFRELKESD